MRVSGVGGAGGGTGTQNFRTTHGTATGSPAEILAANASRRYAQIRNTDNDVTLYVGTDALVGPSDGISVAPGEWSPQLPTTAAIYGATDGGNCAWEAVEYY